MINRLTSILNLATYAAIATNSWNVSDAFANDFFQIKSEFTIERPAFITISKIDPNQLYISSFGKNMEGKVTRLESISNWVENGEVNLNEIAKDYNWPNEVKEFKWNEQNYLVVANGFFSPPFTAKNRGSIGIVPLEDLKSPNVEIGVHGNRWFYHQPELIDINQDGFMDIVTARTNWSPLPFSGKTKGELVYFQNPGYFSGEWKEQFLLDDPEVYFQFADLDGDGDQDIVVPEVFKEKLSIFINENGNYRKRVIDNSIGLVFDVRVVDLNLDGSLEILTTNHQNDATAGVFAYTIPSDIKADKFQRKTLLQGIETTKKGVGQASPGTAQPYYLSKNIDGKADKKPWIIVSGDGSQRVHLLIANSQEPEDWSYSEHIIFEGKDSVTGGIQIADIDSNGIDEIIVPAYHEDKVYLLERK